MDEAFGEGLQELEYAEVQRESKQQTAEDEFIAECEVLLDGQEETRDAIAHDHVLDMMI